MKPIKPQIPFDELERKIRKRLLTDVKKKVSANVFRSVNLVRNTAVESIARGAKTGTLYRKYNPNRTHRASAPNQPPATDTGFLVQNIVPDMTVGKDVVEGTIISQAPYSAFLEFGTSKMAARPFLQPALEQNRRKINRIFGEGVL